MNVLEKAIKMCAFWYVRESARVRVVRIPSRIFMCACERVFLHRYHHIIDNTSPQSCSTDLGSRYQPIVIEDNSDSEIDTEDAALSALLHERVVKVKQEIDWDLEEQKLREKRREKELKLKEVSSSDNESDSAVSPEVRWHRRNGRGKWAWPVPNSMSNIGARSNPKNDIQEEGTCSPTKQVVMIDPSSQIFTTVALQPGFESDDTSDQDDTIVYSQHNSSIALYHGQSHSQSIPDNTGTESTDSMSDAPPVQNHHQFQNSCAALHPRPEPRNEVVLAGASPPPHDSNHRCRRGSEFLSSINSEVENDRPSKVVVYKPTLDVHIPDYPDDTTVNLPSCDSPPSDRQLLLPMRVKPCNIVDVIKIDSQSSTEGDILSGTVSEAEDSQHFSTRQPMISSRGRSSAVANKETKWDGSTGTTSTSQSESGESELDTLPRPSWIRQGEEELLSGYESGYVETTCKTRNITRVASSRSRSRSLSSTPPPGDDVMTPPPGDDVPTPAPPPGNDVVIPPSSHESQESTATSVHTTIKLKPLQLSLTPVCTSPQKELLTSINPPLPPIHTPLSEAQVAEVGDPEKKGAAKEASSSGVVQESNEAGSNPNPAMNSSLCGDSTTARDAGAPQQWPVSMHPDPPSPSSPNDSRNEMSEMHMAQNTLSETDNGTASCTCCLWQSTGSVACAHCPSSYPLCLSSCSSTCHAYTYNPHCQQCRDCIQATMSLKGPTNSCHTSRSLPQGENENGSPCSLCSSSHNIIQSTDHDVAPAPCTSGSGCDNLGHTSPSNVSDANSFSLPPPPPGVEVDHSGNHTHFASSCCAHFTMPCMCCSAVQPPSHCNSVLSSRSFIAPSRQLALPSNALKRSRDNEELSSNSSANKISLPLTKRPCL